MLLNDQVKNIIQKQESSGNRSDRKSKDAGMKQVLDSKANKSRVSKLTSQLRKGSFKFNLYQVLALSTEQMGQLSLFLDEIEEIKNALKIMYAEKMSRKDPKDK